MMDYHIFHIYTCLTLKWFILYTYSVMYAEELRTRFRFEHCMLQSRGNYCVSKTNCTVDYFILSKILSFKEEEIK